MKLTAPGEPLTPGQKGYSGSMAAVGAERHGDLHRRGGRIAVISLHTAPSDRPGTGDSGGMNVYILSVARRLAEQGIHVDVFTRSRTGGRRVVDVDGGNRVIEVPAGPAGSLEKERLPGVLSDFLEGVVQFAAADDAAAHRHSPYDVVHSHYWLSGWVGSRTKEIWGVPHVASFHTLGKVKNSHLPRGERREPALRLRGEEGVVRGADRIVTPTPVEARELITLYGADPDRIRVVPPGVDRAIFVPRPRAEARARLGLRASERLALFAGRLQPFKGPDVAIHTVAAAVRLDPVAARGLLLYIVGGDDDLLSREARAKLEAEARSTGVGDRVRFIASRPHPELAVFYSAADVVLVPSRSESFGLVALEAQACGTPVVATAAGGLHHSVREGESGFLVRGRDPNAFAERLLRILRDTGTAARLSRGAVRHAAAFSWEATASDIRAVYREVVRQP